MLDATTVGTFPCRFLQDRIKASSKAILGLAA